VKEEGATLGLAVLLLGSASCRQVLPSPSPTRHLNILLLTIDTLRADHLGSYGYKRNTSPEIDALAKQGTLFAKAHTFWPKTRGSFVMIHTGRLPSANGYSDAHHMLLSFNPTLASVLREAGYGTAAVVDNANVAAELGYGKGFDTYEQVWLDAQVKTEMDGAKAITRGGVRFLQGRSKDRPFFLWLHYVNPHAPYTPPPPYDAAFLDEDARKGPHLRVVSGYHGGIPRPFFVPGERTLGYYVGEYDGEIATVDHEIGEVLEALRRGGEAGETVVLLTSDHGESLGEHDYYFDHGEDLFEPCLAVPLIVFMPGGVAGRRSDVLASTLDIMPTLLDAARIPPSKGLAGESLLGEVLGRRGPSRNRLFAQNDRGLTESWNGRFKLVLSADRRKEDLYDLESDPSENKDVAANYPRELEAARRELDFFLARAREERARVDALIDRAPKEGGSLSPDTCERLRALGYLECGS
jgi:arylsulfatase